MGTIYRICMAALFAVATPSLAAAEEEWNGFYVGAHGGWGFGAVDWILNQSSWFLDNAGEHVHMSGDGIAGGFQAGHLKQWNNGLVSGLEISATALDAKGNYYDQVNFSDQSFSSSLEGLVAATVRLGINGGDVHLYYLEAGGAAGRVAMRNVRSSCSSGPCSFESHKWHAGYIVGAGVDYKAAPNIIIGFNYRYADFHSRTHDGLNTSVPDYENYTVDAQAHILSFRLNWLFNQD